MILFSTTAYVDLAADVAARFEERAAAQGGGRGRMAPGEVERRTFPDGERYLRVASPVAGREAVLLGGTISDGDTLELYDLACGLVQEGAARLTLVLPYFGFATMERAVKPGEVVTAKTRARLLSSVPRPGGGLRVLLVDLHSEGIPMYFEGAVRPVHVYGRDVVLAAARRHGRGGDEAGGVAQPDDFVLACADAGRAKWVQSLANHLGVPAAFLLKRRFGPAATEVVAVAAPVDGRRVVIYDDMIRTGGSLLQAARAYREVGAADVSAVATHGVLPGDALARLRRSGLLSAITCTDTHPRARALADDFLRVESIAPVLAEEIARAW